MQRAVSVCAYNVDVKTRFKFTKSQRLLNKADFENVMRDPPVKLINGQLVQLSVKSKRDKARVGIIVSKKNVKKAVDRNKIKRVIRENFRLHQHLIPATDTVVIARKAIGILTKKELKDLLEKQWKKLASLQKKLL